MGDVDKADQMITYYSMPRKTITQHLKIFFHLLDVSLWNASFLYNFKKTDAREKLPHINFRDAMISVLLDSSTENIMPLPKETQHFPIFLKSRISCRLCTNEGRRNLTWLVCESCKDNMNRLIGLCISDKRNCFRHYSKHLLYNFLETFLIIFQVLFQSFQFSFS